MRHLKLRCLCATCTRVRRAYGTAKLVTPEDCITHILKYGLPAALDTGDESALALLRGHATAEQLPALLPGAAGGVANAQGGHAAAAAPDARAQTTARSDHGAALGAAAGELSGSESPTPQPSVRDGLLAGLADCGGAGERTSGLSSPASDGDAAGAGADGLGRSTSPDSPAGSPERSGGAQPDGGLDGDEAVEELEALMASKLIYPEVEDDLGDDTGSAPPPPPPPPPPPQPQGAEPYGCNAWDAETAFRRVLRRGSERLHPDHPLTLGEVVCDLVALKMHAGLTWGQLMFFVEYLRRVLSGGEGLPRDIETFKRLLCIGDKEVYTVIDECLGCGFLYYSAKTPEFCDLQTCPRCHADRYEFTPEGARPRKTGLILCDIVRQVRLLMRRPKIATALLLHATQRRKDGWMSSQWHGELWEAEEAALPELAQFPWYMRWELLADGLQVNRGMNAKPYSCTPLILRLKNLPPDLEHEYNNVIFAGFTKGPSKPGDSQEVLRVVLEVLDLVWTRGVLAYDGAKDNFVLVKAIVRQASVDGMELPHILHCKGPTAINGDPWSVDRAIRHPSGRQGSFYGLYRRWLAANDPRRSDLAYGPPVTAGPPAPKTHQWYKDTGAALDELRRRSEPASVGRREKSTGVKGSSAFQLHLSYWDTINGTNTLVPPEPMHVTKNICEMLAGQPSDDLEHSSAGFIMLAYAGAMLNSMAVRLSGVRFPSNVGLKPLDVLLKPSVKPYCNSHDWLIWATSGIVPLAMLGSVPRAHFDAFQNLFSAMTIFTSGVAEHPRQQDSTLSAAHVAVIDALVELERILSTPMLTSQLRRLVYMKQYVAQLGPGPTFWAFFAESLYGSIANGNAQRRNPEVAYAAAAMLRAAGASMYEAFDSTLCLRPKPGLCVDELMQFTSHAAQHALDDDERSLFAEAAPNLAAESGDDIIVSRYTHAVHAGRIPLRAKSSDLRAATANSGVMFIHAGEVCFGHVRCFDAHSVGGALAFGFVLVDAYCGAESDYVPWLYEPLNVPCVPLEHGGEPATEALYVSVRDICGSFYYCDGLPSERGDVRTLHRLVPTHYANLMLDRHSSRRRRLLLTVLGRPRRRRVCCLRLSWLTRAARPPTMTSPTSRR